MPAISAIEKNSPVKDSKIYRECPLFSIEEEDAQSKNLPNINQIVKKHVPQICS